LDGLQTIYEVGAAFVTEFAPFDAGRRLYRGGYLLP